MNVAGNEYGVNVPYTQNLNVPVEAEDDIQLDEDGYDR